MHRSARAVSVILSAAALVAACTFSPNPDPRGASTASSTASSSSGDAGSGGAAGMGGMAGAGGIAGMGGTAGAGGMAGAGGTAGAGGSMAAAPKPDFGLTDVNPNSPTSGKIVSPRDYLGQVSAWYFGHAT